MLLFVRAVILRYTTSQALAGVEITAVRDLDSGLDTAQAEGRSRLPWQKGDLMLTFTLDNVHTLTLRASGTEPKLKYYLEVYPCQAKHSKHYTVSCPEPICLQCGAHMGPNLAYAGSQAAPVTR